MVAGDDALRASLVLLLEVCGIEAAGFAVPEVLLGGRPEAHFVFVDTTSSGHGGFAEIDEMRRWGWEGTAIFMAEKELRRSPDLLDGPGRVLVKPFSSDDVLAIVSESVLTRSTEQLGIFT